LTRSTLNLQKDLILNKKSLQKRLFDWFEVNKRVLPWRESANWYHIWISEVMLQQTQVDQVVPYYLRFIHKFKNVEQLAQASEEQVLKVWEGLGYYSRARHLHRSAKIIVEDFQSEIPRNWEALRDLPGFGPYTTSAVLSIAFNHPYGVVDGNIKRVISRLFSLKDDIRKPATHKKIQVFMDSLLPTGRSAIFNEAMMELGALVCQPQKPTCKTCPLNLDCSAFQQGIVEQVPYRSRKNKIPIRKSVAFIISCGGLYLIAKRKPGGMLAGLWEFPTRQLSKEETIKSVEQKFLSTVSSRKMKNIIYKQSINHTYTHFKLVLHPILMISKSVDLKFSGYEEQTWKSITDIKRLPLHRAIWKVLEQVEQDLVAITD